ncbi:MAG: TonB-dependent receptor, partial [Bryobacterales bacterium]|nr:TonB-dependent receptor [Bryobacterales bacterium]
AQRAADGFLINGSVSNGASSPFALLPAFGNNRRGQRSLYNGNIGFIWNNAAFDARAFSLTGQNTPKPGYNRFQGLLAFGGPLKIPKLLTRGGPVLTLNYQWTRNSNANTQTALMPTAAQRAGEFATAVTDPASGLPFPANRLPASRISPQSRSLLDLYPLPNFTGSTRYNYQLPLVSGLHQDDLQTRANKQIRRNFVTGSYAWQSTRTDTPDLYGFLETGSVSGINATAGFRRSFTPRSFVNIGLQYSRFANNTTPYFANRRNVAAEAGIQGNNQDPVNWGPPALLFASGIHPLTQPQYARNRNQTVGLSVDTYKNLGRHNLTGGMNYRRQQFNVFSQQDPRGTFAFTGLTTGADFASFLLGLPDTSSIAFGNADKYLRSRITELFVNDDWRVNPALTINAGLRWEYWSPMEERYGRLVNLDIAPGFTAATPSSNLPRPDRNNLAPRIGFSWRPIAASSLVIRGGYGIYYDTSIYLPVATRMSQQAPLSRSLRVATSPATPLTLANGFPLNLSATDATTFAVDPGFLTGYAQTWQLTIQRDLPAALQVTSTYSGTKGTRAQQEFLPNTSPSGVIPTGGPSGFTFLTSNGNSTRHSAQLQIRRRLRSGFTANATYTYAKAIDNASLGGRAQGPSMIAQNWLDLRAERGRSNFDQRHLLSTMISYTTGMGAKGGALATGRVAAILKDWTIASQINTGTGLPLTPIFFRPVLGTGVTGSLRPDYTGLSVYDAPPGFYLNPAAVTAPAPGRWGNAGRNSITGPHQFALNASLGRTFRAAERISYDFRLEAANALNTVTYPSWNTVAGNAQFGLPTAANPMRTVQAIFRARF